MAGEAAAPAGEPLNVLLFINGSLGDKSFFDSAKRGVDRAVEEFGQGCVQRLVLRDHAAHQGLEILEVGDLHVLLVAELVDHLLDGGIRQLPGVDRLQGASARTLTPNS